MSALPRTWTLRFVLLSVGLLCALPLRLAQATLPSPAKVAAATTTASTATGDTAKLLTLTLKDLDEHPQALQQWHGQVLVINFWATWCPPCVKEMPEFSAVHHAFQDQPVQIIGIGIDQPEAMRDFRARFNIPYPLLTGTASTLSLAARLGNPARALPFTMIFDQAGQLREVKLGSLNQTELAGKIRPLLTRAPTGGVAPN